MIRTFSALVIALAATAAQAAPFNPFAPPVEEQPPAPPPTAELAPPPPPVPAGPPEVVEQVPAVRLGRVNGEYMFRGTAEATYLFTKTADEKLVRGPLLGLAAAAATLAKEELEPLPARPNLPSMVGSRSAPTPAAPSVARPSSSAPKKP